jgi:AcrR family transcriptional regulator
MNTMSSEKRKYELRARAERQDETRKRIAAATAELHEEVGPARTTVAEIARRAGVQRLTVYNNFPDERDLFRACQEHWLARHPPIDPGPALALGTPQARLEAVLSGLYAWYRSTEPMSGNVRRDRELVPALDALLAETTDVRLAGLVDVLLTGLAADDDGPELRAVLALALDFWTWRRLASEGLDDHAAALLMTETVLSRARRDLREASSQRGRRSPRG